MEGIGQTNKKYSILYVSKQLAGIYCMDKIYRLFKIKILDDCKKYWDYWFKNFNT